MKVWQILMVSVAAGITLPALAQMAEGPTSRAEVEARIKDKLGKFDANNDGTVTRDEIMAYTHARMEARADDEFAAMDTDKNGSISRAEFDAFHAKQGDQHIVRIERFGDGPDHMMPPPPRPDGAAPPPPPSGANGKPMIREHTRIMMMGDHDGMVMADGDGKGIVIADAVKKALAHFDAVDTNHDGKISPEERKAAHEAMRAKVS